LSFSPFLKGTICSEREGININLAGTPDNINPSRFLLKSDVRFMDMSFQNLIRIISLSGILKVKLKKESLVLVNPA